MGTDLGVAPIEHRPNQVEAYREKREGGEEPLSKVGDDYRNLAARDGKVVADGQQHNHADRVALDAQLHFRTVPVHEAPINEALRKVAEVDEEASTDSLRARDRQHGSACQRPPAP